jgi:hypothetical protein
VNISLDPFETAQGGQNLALIGFASDQWAWAHTNPATGQPATLSVPDSDLYILTVKSSKPVTAIVTSTCPA